MDQAAADVGASRKTTLSLQPPDTFFFQTKVTCVNRPLLKSDEKWKLVRDGLDRNVARPFLENKLARYNFKTLKIVYFTNKCTKRWNKKLSDDVSNFLCFRIRNYKAAKCDKNEMRMRKWLRERLQRERCRFDRIVKINEHVPMLLETLSHASRTIERDS